VRLLLDTHVWIWALEQPERLSKKVASALSKAESELWLSPISVWEFLLLAERRRVRMRGNGDGSQWVEQALARAPMHEAPITREVAVVSRALAIEHDDPADRFLAATAAVYDLTLVTGDERLLRAKGFRTLANR
jgi:PIN domain nuclease of toxin-antitoxin system